MCAYLEVMVAKSRKFMILSPRREMSKRKPTRVILRDCCSGTGYELEVKQLPPDGLAVSARERESNLLLVMSLPSNAGA